MLLLCYLSQFMYTHKEMFHIFRKDNLYKSCYYTKTNTGFKDQRNSQTLQLQYFNLNKYLIAL